MSDNLNIGGVSYTKNMVASKKVTKNQNEKTYLVTLKSGITLEYPKQKDCSVKGHSHGIFSNCNHLTINGMNKGKIIGSKDDDKITLSFCKNIDVDVSNDVKDLFGGDTINIHSENGEKSDNINVKTDLGNDKVVYNGNDYTSSYNTSSFSYDF